MKLLTKDGLEVEATKEQIEQIESMRESVWKKYDSWEKCFVKINPQNYITGEGKLSSPINLGILHPSVCLSHSTTSNRSKAILAYLQLSVIAEAWNGEILNDGFAVSPNSGHVTKIIPRYGIYVLFKTIELASKSYELFRELYNDLKNADL